MFIYFYSIEFFVFLLFVLTTFWSLPARYRPYLMLFASYVFYGSWDWRCLPIILFSTGVDYLVGLKIARAARTKSASAGARWLSLSVGVNLGMLFVFKYMNFFVAETSGWVSDPLFLDIVLPVGISFYTFQSMSYSFDVYRGKIPPQENFFKFALYVSYFPQLIAGPIERASDLMPQMSFVKTLKSIEVEKSLHLIGWGLFKKIAVADQIGVYVDEVFAQESAQSADVLWASYAFYFQVFCDFSGYTNIARGVSLLFGVELTPSFRTPFFAKNPSDFWNRWNLTLSQWVKHYLFVPAALWFNSIFLSLFLSYVIMGVWHGARYTYLLWGVYWFVLAVAFQAGAPRRIGRQALWASAISWVLLFQCASFGMLLFRSESVSQFFRFSSALFMDLSGAVYSPWPAQFWLLVGLIVLWEAKQFLSNNEFFILKWNFYLKSSLYVLLYIFYRQGAAVEKMEFIYFQF